VQHHRAVLALLDAKAGVAVVVGEAEGLVLAVGLLLDALEALQDAIHQGAHPASPLAPPARTIITA
jgi:hypothetical protein